MTTQAAGPAAPTDSGRAGKHLGFRLLAPLRPSEHQLLFLWAGLVGFLGAGAALLFQFATAVVQRVLVGSGGEIVAAFARLPTGRRLLVPVAGAILAGAALALTHRFVRRRETDYMEGISLGNGDLPVGPSLGRATAALFSIASGAAIGREGPLVQIAAITGSLSGRLRRMSQPRRRMLVACGAAAGMAAAYHTPLGGALFVGEVVLGSLTMEALGPLLIASVVSALTVRGIEGAAPLYPYAGFAAAGAWEYLLFALLGAVCGVGAYLWIRLLRTGRQLFGAVPGPPWLRLALGGLVIGALAVLSPEATGNGTTLIRSVLASDYAWRAIAMLLVLRVVATTAAFGSGAVGGVFTPSLLAGGGIGYLMATLALALRPGTAIDPGSFTLIGMGGFMAAAAQAPITAILMLFEFTLQYEIVLPLMVAVVVAYSTARALGSDGLYAESLRAGPRSLFDRRLESVTVQDLLRPQTRLLAVDSPFHEIAGRFLRSPDREQWVADGDGRYAGAILLKDVEPFLRTPALADTVIALDIMRTDVAGIATDVSLTAALDRFTHEWRDTLPVLDEDGRVLGSIVREDLLLTISELARRERTRTEDRPA